MAVSTVFTNTENQVWVVTHTNTSEENFGTIEEAKAFCEDHYRGINTRWEEMPVRRDTGQPVEVETSSRKRQMGTLSSCEAVSALMLCTESTTFGQEAPVQRWRDTGWQMRRVA